MAISFYESMSVGELEEVNAIIEQITQNNDICNILASQLFAFLT